MIYLRGADVARILGKSQSQLVRERKRGEGPPWVPGRSPRYPADQLREWLIQEAERRKAKAESNAESWRAGAFEAFDRVIKNLQHERTE